MVGIKIHVVEHIYTDRVRQQGMVVQQRQENDTYDRQEDHVRHLQVSLDQSTNGVGHYLAILITCTCSKY